MMETTKTQQLCAMSPKWAKTPPLMIRRSPGVETNSLLPKLERKETKALYSSHAQSHENFSAAQNIQGCVREKNMTMAIIQ